MFSAAVLDKVDTLSTRCLVAETCTRMRVFNHASGPVVEQAKVLAKNVATQIRQSFETRVAALPLARPIQVLDSVVQTLLDAIKSVESKNNESAALDIPLVRPVPRVLGKRTLLHKMPDGRERSEIVDDVMFDQPFERTLQQFLEYNPDALRDVLNSNAAWREKAEADEKADLQEFRIVDVTDAQGFKRHQAYQNVGRDGAPVQLFLILYGDGAKIANPIGVFRNNSNVDLFYWALINLDVSHRMSLSCIQLAAVCKNEDLKRYGPELVLSAAAPEGSAEVSTSFGAAMHRMSLPSQIAIPNPTAKDVIAYAFINLWVQVWCCLVLADCPAAAEIFCFKKAVGPSTILPCRLCLACQVDPDNPLAMPLRRCNSFLPWDQHGNCSDHDMTSGLDLKRRGHYQLWDLRTSKQLDEQRLHAEQLPATARAAYEQSIGVTGFQPGLHSPGLDINGAPVDIMHAEWEGNGQKHLLGLLAVMIYVWCSVELPQLNRALRDHPWPPGCHPQPFSDSSFQHYFKDGSFVCRGDVTMNTMTAHDFMVFMLHSVAILGQFVPDVHWGGPHWKCWCKHVDYATMLLQHSFSLDQVRLLDVTIFTMQELFLSIPEYFDLWTPNFHYAQHFAMDILLWGPAALRSCLRFEAKNQQFIQAGRHTNFKSLLESMALKVATRRAFELKAGVHNNRLQPTLFERCIEMVGYGTSSAIDAMWEDGLIAEGRTTLVSVLWLVAVQVGPYKYAVGGYVSTDSGLAMIWDLLSIGNVIYISLKHFIGQDESSVLLKDPVTGQLFVWDKDFASDSPCHTTSPQQLHVVTMKALHSAAAPSLSGSPTYTKFWHLYNM